MVVLVGDRMTSWFEKRGGRARGAVLAALLGTIWPGVSRAAVSCGGVNTDGAMLCTIDPSLDPHALCNDGTLPSFWVRPGSGAGATQWVIWLEGGGQCTDQTSCAARAQGADAGFVTANGFGAGTGQGILASDARTNPMLHNANTVLVHYCSSDLWSGGRVASAPFNPGNPATWYFEGRPIALAAIASLSELGLGFGQGTTRIVLGGSSAGGVGIAVTAHDIVAVLPDAPDIRLIDDAGFALNIGQYDPQAPAPYVYAGHATAFLALIESGIALWNGRGDASCALQATTPAARAACYSSAIFQRGYIQMPAFVAESQLDLAQITDELCPQQYGDCGVSHDPRSMPGQYATAFGATMAAALTGTGNAAWTVFSPDLYLHVLMTDPDVFTQPYAFPGGRISPRQAVDAWLAGNGSGRVVNIGNQPGVNAIRHVRARR